MSGDEKTAGSERVTNAADLHDVLGLPHPSSPSGALEPIPVTAATFASSLRPAFALGAISYRVQIGAVRLHKRVAFLETHVLGEGGGQALGAHANAVARDSDVPAERRTLTQLVVDAAVIGEDRFEETRGLCLGDVLDVDARWIWDPKRAHPLNLAVSRFRVVTRWDEEPIVALRKGGFHKVREHKRAEPETGPDPGDRAGGCGLGGTGGCVTSGGPGAGSRGLKVRGVIKTRRVQDPAASRASETEGGGEESSADAREAHGSWEGAKDRARKMCAWILEKVGGAAALRGARGAEVEEGEEGGGVVLDVAGGAGYLAMELCKVGVPVTLVDPRPPRSFNRSERKWAGKRKTPMPEHLVSLFDDAFLSNPAHQALLGRVSLVVAMHADAATEPAIAWATRAGKPVVAVPCCVFPSLFPHRLSADGRPVVSRADFLDYLCERYSLAKERIEVFAGANVACFSPNLAGPAAEGGMAKQ